MVEQATGKQMATHRLVVVGGGFAGVALIKSLGWTDIEITLIDRRNYHLFQPLLYQVATGGLSPANISAPLREIFRRQKNCRTLLGEVTSIDPAARTLVMDEQTIPYDTLVVAAGAATSYFGNQAWEDHAVGLKTIEEATEIRSRILFAFERAELSHDPEEIRKLMTFAIVGGGPTGVEMAGAVSELAHYTLKGDFRSIDATKARILLIDGAERVLSSFDPSSSARALASLQRIGVEVWSKGRVKQVDREKLLVDRQGTLETVMAGTIVWAAGVKGAPLGAKVAQATGVAADKGGRIPVLPDLTVVNHSNIFVIGDLASVPMGEGGFVPGVAPAAMQMGQYVGKVLKSRLKNAKPPEPFQYFDKGSMATIGRAAAVVEMSWPKWKFGGFLAWVAWLFVHLSFLIEFENRLLVLLQWAGNYFTRNRSALLITNPGALTQELEEEKQRAARLAKDGLMETPQAKT